MVQPRKEKKKPKNRVGITIQCVTGEDDDLIQWYQGIPHGQVARIMKAVLRRNLAMPESIEIAAAAPTFGVVTKEDLNQELDKFATDFKVYVQLELQRALSSYDYNPVSNLAPSTEKVDAEKLKQRAKNIDKDSW
jgi:hypothetical protein